MNQLAMFSELPPGGRARGSRTPCKRQFRAACVQLAFELGIRTELIQVDDDPLITAPIVHRTVSANGAAPLATRAPASVWDMAFKPVSVKRQEHTSQKITMRVVRGEGVTKCVRILPSETDEWKEREIARRAKQRPPKPTKKAKLVGKGIAGLPAWD